MAVLGQNFLNLIDIFKQTEDGQKIAAVIELLKQNNPILDDIVSVECNMGTFHRHSIRTGLPSVAWGALYQGIAQSKAQTQQVDDTTGFLEGLSSVDERLLQISPNEGAVRLNEAMAYLEAMNQEMATSLFYADTATTPTKFKGLGARYNVIGGGGAGNQVVSAGGAGSDNTSIWFVTWGDHATHGLYPKGSKAGVDRQDMGRQRVQDGSGNPYYVKEEKFTWHMGVAVKDWRYNARIANIDVSEVQAGKVDLYAFMRKAYYKLQNRINRTAGARQAIYMNRDMLEALDALAVNKGAADNFVRLTPKEIEGQEVLTYRGIPIRQVDAILNTEAVVPAAS